jgi:S-adenosylmethionine hydrolase
LKIVDEATVPIITLLSDFGLKDPYVAEMKAVILSVHPQACIVDITHEIEKFNIRMGAFVLASAAPYFPSGTIHVAVVDPGVGTKRRPIIVETKRSYYVGPDNGLLMLAAQKEGVDHVYHINNLQYMLPRVSRTFHGRDIFATVAAHLATKRPSEFGPEIQDYAFPEFAKPHVGAGEMLGEVLHIDDFGNIVSNISAESLEKMGIRNGSSLHVKLDSETLTLKLCSAYGEVPAKTPLAIIGSNDFLEISINQWSASRTFETKIGDPLRVSLASSN